MRDEIINYLKDLSRKDKTIRIELPYRPYGAQKIPNIHSKSILSLKGQYVYIKLKYIETKFHA